MLNIGGPELLIILLVALVVLGPERLPGAARQVGRTVNQLRSMAQGFQQELEAAAKPEVSTSGSGTDPEHIRTAAKSTGAQMFGGTGAAEAEPTAGTNANGTAATSDTAAASEKAVSTGGPSAVNSAPTGDDPSVDGGEVLAASADVSIEEDE